MDDINMLENGIVDVVTKKDFIKYEIVRESGIVNMCDTLCVSEISGLDFNTVRRIRREYEHLYKKYRALAKIEIGGY